MQHNTNTDLHISIHQSAVASLLGRPNNSREEAMPLSDQTVNDFTGADLVESWLS